MRWIVSSWLAVVLLGQTVLAWDDPPAGDEADIKSRTGIVREVTTAPVFATFRNARPSPDRERVTVLGNRDDSRESTYVLEARGSEVGAGKRTGRYGMPGMERAGCPRCIRPLAKPSRDGNHSIGYVGGGTPFDFWGERRRVNEGTVGMDYSGWLFQRKTWLQWSHGGLDQGGAGRYETEGPRLIRERE